MMGIEGAAGEEAGSHCGKGGEPLRERRGAAAGKAEGLCGKTAKHSIEAQQRGEGEK